MPSIFLGFLGDPPICQADTASATLYTCFLEEKGVAYNNLHLTDETCKGAYDASAKTITFEFGGSKRCGGKVTVGPVRQISRVGMHRYRAEFECVSPQNLCIVSLGL